MSEDLTSWGRTVLAQQPFSALVGCELHALSAGDVELRLPVTDQLRQQHDFVHGGVVAYLADNALTYAGGTRLGGGAVVTIEMKINYVRPALGEVLIARATALTGGKTPSVARCDVFAVADGVEKLCAAAQGTIGLLPKKD